MGTDQILDSLTNAYTRRPKISQMKVKHSNEWDGLPYPSPRDWQADARPEVLEAIESGASGIVQAIMGAGKSGLIGEVCHSLRLDRDETVVITTPTVRLVSQLYDSLTDRLPSRAVGRYYTKKKAIKPFTVCCMASAPKLGRTLDHRGKSVPLWIADEAHKTECDTIHDADEHLDAGSKIGFTATPFRAKQDEELSLYNELLYEYTASDAIDDNIVVPPKIIHPEVDGQHSDIDQACLEMIKRIEHVGPGMANAATIKSADQFSKFLSKHGIESRSVHSKKSERKIDEIMHALKYGKIDCAVHVNMLSEGANFPWLRWICMRRHVRSRNRFCQEVGRVLRTYQNKDYAYVLDPHDLFNRFDLDYQAVLNGDVEDDDKDDDLTEIEALLNHLEKNLTKSSEYADVLNEIEAYYSEESGKSWFYRAFVHEYHGEDIDRAMKGGRKARAIDLVRRCAEQPHTNMALLLVKEKILRDPDIRLEPKIHQSIELIEESPVQKSERECNDFKEENLNQMITILRDLGSDSFITYLKDWIAPDSDSYIITSVDTDSTWLRRTKLALKSYGYIDKKSKGTHWRDDDMTSGQAEWIKKKAKAGARLPEQHKDMARECCKKAFNKQLTKGEASDLLSILFALNDYGWPEEVDSLVA